MNQHTDTPTDLAVRTAGLVKTFGDLRAVDGIDLEVRRGEIFGVLGPNGAGKTTMLRVVSGLVALRGGDIRLGDVSLAGMRPDEVVAHGVAHVPQGRRVFPDFTVEENLRVAAYSRGGRDVDDDIARVLDAFPRLRDRLGVRAGFLSGGEQQMLAIGRAVVQRPRLVLIDEMSLGLAPVLVDALLEILREVHAGGVTILLVEQDVEAALEFAQRAYVLETGRITLAGTCAQLRDDPGVQKAYLGI
jgi:branched-chain amino acid transport system ATP-binding protein